MKLLNYITVAVCLYVSSITVSMSASVLNNTDIETYKNIFALQQDGKWKQADKHIKKVHKKF